MTVTLAVGGLLVLVLAYWLTGAPAPAFSGKIKLWFAMIWPAIAALMVLFVFAEGEATEDAVGNGIRLVGKTRVTLVQAGIGLESDVAEVYFGGDPARDHIVLQGYPAKALTASRDGDRARIAWSDTDFDGRRLAVFINGELQAATGAANVTGPAELAVAMASERPTLDLAEALDKDQLEDWQVTRLRLEQPIQGWQVSFGDPPQFHAPRGNIRPASADIINQPRDGENVTPFPMLGGGFGPLFESTELVLPDASGQSTEVRSSERPKSFPNSAVEIARGDFSVLLRIDPLNLNSGLRGFAKWAIWLVLLVSLALSWRLRREQPLCAAFLGLAEILLLLRIILAIEGGMVEETTRSREALGDALVALPLGLLAIHAAMIPFGRRLAVAVIALAACGGVMVVANAQTSSGEVTGSITSVAAICLALTLFALILRAQLANLADFSDRMRRSLVDRVRYGGSTEGRLARVKRMLGPWITPVLPSFALIALLIIARVGLRLADAPERIELGGGARVALSVFFIPLTVLALYPVLFHLLRDAGSRWVGGLVFAVAIMAGVLLPNLVAGDSGLAIMLSLAICIVAASVWQVRWGNVGWQSWLAISALALGAVLVLANLLAGNTSPSLSWLLPATLLAVGGWLVWQGRAGDRPAELLWLGGLAGIAALVAVTAIPLLQPILDAPPAAAEVEAVTSVAELRLTSALVPEKLGFLASPQARTNRDSIEDIAEYGRTATGYGYLNVPNIEHSVRGQQFSDFAIALHFVFPFGRLALAGLVLLVGSAGLIALSRLNDRRGTTLLGVMACAVFAGTCIYIALANLLLAPVTGRNFYLLAPQSHSDLLEGLFLLVSAAVLLLGNDRAAEEAA